MVGVVYASMLLALSSDICDSEQQHEVRAHGGLCGWSK